MRTEFLYLLSSYLPMLARVSVKLKLPVTTELSATCRAYQKALQHCIDIAWSKQIKNNVQLHPYVYTAIRSEFKLPAQLAISCIKQAAGMVKKAKSKPLLERVSVRYNFPRSAGMRNEVLTLRTLTKRNRYPLTIPPIFQEYFSSWDLCESLLRIDKKGRCFFIFCFSKEIIPTISNSPSVLGIDLGIHNLAVTSSGRFFNSHKVKQAKRKFTYLRSTLQAKGTRSAKKLLRKLSGRETRYMTWVNHNISKTIVSGSNATTVVLENLKGIRQRNRGTKMNHWIGNWSFFQLQFFLQYKAERLGVTVTKVNPQFTSQLCHRCGKIGIRNHAQFRCVPCGIDNYSADLNAARNLSHPKLGERQAAVNQPHIPNRDCTVQEFRDNLMGKRVMPQSLL